MDGSTGRLLIKRRRAALEEATDAATAEPADLVKAKALLEQANTIDAIRAKIGEPDRHLLAKIAAFACLTLVAVALSNLIRVGGPRISLQAETSELSFLVTADSKLGLSAFEIQTVRAASVIVDGRPNQNPNLEDMTSFTELKSIGRQTSVLLRKSPDGCFQLLVPSGLLQVTLAGGSPENPLMQVLGLPPEGQIDLCPKGGSKLVVQLPRRVRFAALWEEATPPLFLPSLAEGRLEFLSTGIVRRLNADQRIELSGTEGSLITEFRQNIRAGFSGTAHDVRQFASTGPQSGGRDLRPTLAEAVLASPMITSLTTALVGVWGFLWSLSRLFSRS